MTALVLLLACGSGPTTPPTPEAPAAPTRVVLDDATRAAFAEVRASVDEADVSSVTAIAASTQSLNTQIQALMAGCTMRGESRQQLDEFLTEFQPAVTALAAHRDDPARAAQHLVTLSRMVSKFDRTFE